MILTLGADGAFYRHRDGTELHSPAFMVAVTCTCGGGDCFDGGFATGLGNQAGVRDDATTLALIRATPRCHPKDSLVSAAG